MADNTYRLMQLVSIKTSMAAICVLLDALSDQVNDVDGIDEEREAIKNIFGRSDRLYNGLRRKILKESGEEDDPLPSYRP